MKTKTLTVEDATKAAIMILEIFSHKFNYDFNQQMFVTGCMMEILKSSFSDLKLYNELEANAREKAHNELITKYGLESKK